MFENVDYGYEIVNYVSVRELKLGGSDHGLHNWQGSWAGYGI